MAHSPLMDHTLRALQRTPHTPNARRLSTLLRAGAITHDQITLAALLGDPDAVNFLGATTGALWTHAHSLLSFDAAEPLTPLAHPEGLDAFLALPRGMFVLDVSWSAYARRNAFLLRHTATIVRHMLPSLEIAFGSLDGDAEWLRPDQAPERFKAWTSSCPSGTGPLHWYSGGAKVGKLTPKAGWEDPLRMVLQRTQDAFRLALPARTA